MQETPAEYNFGLIKLCAIFKTTERRLLLTRNFTIIGVTALGLIMRQMPQRLKRIVVVFIYTLFVSILTYHMKPNICEITPNHKMKEWIKYTSLRDWKFKLYQEVKNFSTHKLFQPMINAGQYLLMIELWDKFTDVCSQSGISYILYGGTLLGSYRHHGFVPWDDDIDVIVKKSDIVKLELILSRVYGFGTQRVKHCLKFFQLQNDNASPWPYVDIFFYEENQTHLWDAGWPYNFIIWEKEKYFPIKYRPLEDKFHPVPNDVEYALKREGKNDINLCETNSFNHIKEYVITNKKIVNCNEISELYPFVKYLFNGDTTTEILKVNGTILSEYTFAGQKHKNWTYSSIFRHRSR